MDYQTVLELGLSPDLPTLTQRTVSLAAAMGFGLTSGVLIRGRFGSPNALMKAFGNPPAGYEETVASLPEGLRDPLLGTLLARPGQVVYDQAFYASRGAGDLWEAQAPFGFKSGLAVALHHNSHAEAFLLGMDGPDALPEGTSRLLLQGQLQLLAAHAQAAMERIVAGPACAPPELTKPERTALSLAGATIVRHRGHLSAVPQLGASPALRSAARKLGARTAPELALRAIEGGLLHP